MQVGASTVAPRARAAISCTECHKRRKRCSEGLPCRNCARRYPTVECIYKPHPNSQRRRSTAQDSADKAGSDQSTSSQPVLQSETLGTLAALPDVFTTSKHVQTRTSIVPSHPEVELPTHGQSLPIESQIPACALLDKVSDVLNHETTPFDYLAMAKKLQEQPTLAPAFGSGIMDMLPSLKVAPTAGNAELFSIYTKVLVPWLWTVDGYAVEAPPGCWKSWIPFSIFSPMILYTNLHRAAIWREMVRPTALRVEVNSKAIADVSPDCIVLRGQALTLLRNHLSSSSPDASNDEAMCTVACVFFNEWSWCIEHGMRNILPHVKFLCAMLKIRGGMSKIEVHAAGLLMIIHYQTAAILEREPWAFPADLIKDRFVPDYRPVKSTFDSPLYKSNGSFAEKVSEIGLHAITAQILDDLTLVLNGVRSVILEDDSKSEYGDVLQTAIGIHDRISSLRSANEAKHPTTKDYIYETCRLAALIYLRAIINRTQFSKTWHPEELQELFSVIILTPMQYWKPISGVWLFVLLSINPPRDELYPGAMFKFFLKTSSFHMAAWDWQCWVNIMETYLALQKWIRTPRNVLVTNSWSTRKTSDVLHVEDIQSVYGMRPV